MGSYMSPYMAKIAVKKQPVLVIDGYAGPGVFNDGKAGSPMIICQAGEKFAKGKYEAVFINKNQEHHYKLSKVLTKAQWLTSAKPVLGDTTLLLPQLYARLHEKSVLLYLDPFGPTGCQFSLLQPFLERDPNYSTEILLTMNIPGLHRLATRRAVENGRQEEQMIKDFHQTLTDVLGGDYWKNIMWQSSLSAEDKELKLIEAYQMKLAQYMPYTGFCPVREQKDKRIKYFIVFASRHSHTPTLLNDAMLKAYYKGMYDADYPNGSIWSWEDLRDTSSLEAIILETVAQNQGKTREAIWLEIVLKHFMVYQEKEYRKEIQKLVDVGKLVCPTPRKTKLLNDDCTLFLPQKESFFIVPTLF